MSRNIYISSLLSAALFLSACGHDDPAPFRLSDSLVLKLESESSLEGGTLTVFDRDATPVKFSPVGGLSSGVYYSTESWTGQEPLCASSRDNASCTAEGALALDFPSHQSADTSIVLAAGGITQTAGNYTLKLKEIYASVASNVESDGIASIEIESAEGETLAGDVLIDCRRLSADSLSWWSESASGVQSSKVELSAAGGLAPGQHLVRVLPGTLAHGIRIVQKDASGNIVKSKTSGSVNGLSLLRGQVFDSDAKVLPDTVRIDLNFWNEQNVNPLGFGTLAQIGAENAETGEDYTYTYEYEYDGERHQEPFVFTVCKGVAAGSYQYNAPSSPVYGPKGRKVLMLGGQDGAWIKLPAIPGRVLKSVTLSHGNTSPKQMQVRPSVNGAVYGYTSRAASQVASASSLNTQTVSFPNTQSGVERVTTHGTSYYLCFTSGKSLQIFDIEIIYTHSL